MAAAKKIPATVTAVIHHLDGVRTLLLKPQRRIPKFAPGQFLHLAIDSYDPSLHWPDSRVFSICSAPESRDEVRITFSKVGKFTSRMMELTEGDDVWLKLPYGDFTIAGHGHKTNILIAGGTGITPFMSWIWSEAKETCETKIIYGARSPEHLIFENALNTACYENGNLSWTPFLEEGEYPGAIRGRLNINDIFRVCKIDLSHKDYNFFISGPPQMIDYFQKSLIDKSVPQKNIFVDAW
ncbi:MAG: FAD-dependent oxidoreductase [Deltaproteobacteria bacterium]|nr:FAD-dependent oxidoreductase [Deltaproteobacteria bacterium]